MKYNIIFFVLLSFIYVGCSNNHSAKSHTNEHDAHDHHNDEHDHEHEDLTTNGDDHNHDQREGNAEKSEDEHEHENVKIYLTAYSNDFELFAEADPFAIGETSNVLSHFSNLPDFSALKKGSITINLSVNGKNTKQTLHQPTKKGIYSFNIKPETAGLGVLTFDIKTAKGNFQLVVPQIEVFNDQHDAIHEAMEVVLPTVNTTVFTKEQSWKTTFATELPIEEPFGQLIKTTAQVRSAQGDEIFLTAKTNGVIMLSSNYIVEGKDVSKGQVLFSISGKGLTNNNSIVQFKEAQNQFEKTKLDYERLKKLAKDKIISEKKLLDAKIQHDNAKVIFDQFSKNFSSSGQSVTSTMNGFIKQVFIKNGEYVEAGQSIVSISQNKKLLLHANIQQKYAPLLGSINSAIIRTIHNRQAYTLEQLNGKVISYGKSTNNDNYLIPVNLQIDNNGMFVTGSFVELYLKTITNNRALTIPNTALLEEQGCFFVFVQITPELFEKREIITGATDGMKTEIKKGITADERIVTAGTILIKLAQAAGTLDPHSGHVH